MSDTKLRDLERRWKETHAPQDEAVYLLERVRVGDLTQERLELAAYCGHEAARSVVGGVDAPTDFVEWLGGLASLGLDVACRAQLIVGRALVPHCGLAAEDVTRALDCLERWIEAPTPELAESASSAGVFASDQVPHGPTAELRQAIWTGGGIAAIPAGVLAGHETLRRATRDAAARAIQVMSPEPLRYACEEGLRQWALSG